MKMLPCPVCKAGPDDPCRAIDFSRLPGPHDERLPLRFDPEQEATPIYAETLADAGTCGATAYRCRCIKAAGHVEDGDDVHGCDPDECGGSWRGSEEADDFAPVTFPNPLGGGGLGPFGAALLSGALGGPAPGITVPRGGIRFGEPRE